MGKTVVTNIHTKARKMVLPRATLLNTLKMGRDILGAEYRKVTKADMINQGQKWKSLTRKKTDPASPMRKRMIYTKR